MGTDQWNQHAVGEYGHQSVEPACCWWVRASISGTSMLLVSMGADQWNQHVCGDAGTSRWYKQIYGQCCHQHFGGSSHSIITITNAMFRWKYLVSTWQKTPSLAWCWWVVFSKSMLILQQWRIHSLMDEKVSIWPGCRGSQGEFWIIPYSSVIILPSVCRFGRNASLCMSNIILNIAQQYPVPWTHSLSFLHRHSTFIYNNIIRIHVTWSISYIDVTWTYCDVDIVLRRHQKIKWPLVGSFGLVQWRLDKVIWEWAIQLRALWHLSLVGFCCISFASK